MKPRIYCDLCKVYLYENYYKRHKTTKNHLKHVPPKFETNYICTSCSNIQSIDQIILMKSQKDYAFEGCTECLSIIKNM